MRRRSLGFTLIEVMVALMILAVMSLMSWKGMDAIMRSREIAEASVRRTLRLQSVMKQWQADLRAVMDVRVVPPIKFDGSTLRMTRSNAGGVQVVAWALRNGHWVRWAGDPVTNVGLLQDQWNKSLQLQGREDGTLAALKGVEQWQVFFYVGGTLTNPQNTLNQAVPEGVRCVLVLGEEAGFTGRIVRDVQVAPQPN